MCGPVGHAPAVGDFVGVKAHLDLLFIYGHAVGAEVHVGATETPWIVQVVSERDHVGHANRHAGLLLNLERMSDGKGGGVEC